jgi:hypothetical protein
MRRLVLSGISVIPWFGGHTSTGNQQHDIFVRHLGSTFKKRHSTVDDIKSEMLFTTNFRADNPVQDRNLFGAIKARDLKASATFGNRTDGRDVTTPATAARVVTLSIFVVMVVVVGIG